MRACLSVIVRLTLLLAHCSSHIPPPHSFPTRLLHSRLCILPAQLLLHYSCILDSALFLHRSSYTAHASLTLRSLYIVRPRLLLLQCSSTCLILHSSRTLSATLFLQRSSPPFLINQAVRDRCFSMLLNLHNTCIRQMQAHKPFFSLINEYL